MAQKKTPRKTANSSPKKSAGSSEPEGKSSPPFGLIFWIGFIILIVLLFLANRATIMQTIDQTDFFNKLKNPASIINNPVAVTPTPDQAPTPAAAPINPITPEPAVDTHPAPRSVTRPPTQNEPPAKLEPAAPVVPETARPVVPEAAAPVVPEVAAPAKPVKPEAKPVAASRDRTIWYTKIDADGHIGQEKIIRQLPVSDAPLKDAVDSLLAGPTVTEAAKGLSSLMPPGTTLLSALVRGTTAYLSFNENFQFNAYGIEGYAGQLRQIIWTATEFGSIKDVQILIEGRRVDYLGSEGIWIGSPLNRDSL